MARSARRRRISISHTRRRGHPVSVRIPCEKSLGTPRLPPAISSPPTTTFARGGYACWCNVNAHNRNGEALTYALTQSPPCMTINAESGFVQWTPAEVGNYLLTVRAVDSAWDFSTQGYILHVGS